MISVLSENNVPRIVRVVTPIALFAIPHDVDTPTMWTVDLDIGYSVLLCGE